MASNVTSFESSNGTGADNESENESSTQVAAIAGNLKESVECSEPPWQGPVLLSSLLSCSNADHPRFQNMLMYLISQMQTTVEKILKTIQEGFEKEEIDVKKMLQQLQLLQPEAQTKLKIDTQSLLLRQERLNIDLYDRIVAEIQKYVLPRSRATVPHHLQRSVQELQVSGREGSAIKVAMLHPYHCQIDACTCTSKCAKRHCTNQPFNTHPH